MNRSQALLIAVAVVVVLSGCNALTGSDTETDTPTVTPAAVPTDEPTPTPVPMLAPGLTRAGVVSASDLADAHDTNLADGSFRLYTNQSVRYDNGTLRVRLNQTARIANGSGSFYSVGEYKGLITQPPVNFPERFKTWSDGEQVFTASIQENNTSYRRTRQSRADYDFRRSSRFFTLFNALETRVVGQETRNDTKLYIVRATNLTNPEYLPGIYPVGATENPRNISFRALIDSQGIVRSHYLAYTTTDIQRGVNTTNRITQSVRYTDIGSTTVDRPDWYEAANRTITVAE
ncbi:DUF7537 family lipoprotein [Halococcus saccharolyticus]|uniref:Lipoprotein n=1 Tax=Halococcus saccharolyticus DSM 5350 TaxID=1227455 RepID=M0MTN6_9EURY|nr:hypothetical protein [Halococcus saccharolyticus]EMA47835.1 hypothetical protein C449_00145 [Halococcus saccharolyticus DSM 5350]